MRRVSAFLAWFFCIQPAAELAPPTAAATLNVALFVLAPLALVATAEAARRYYERSLAGQRRFRAAEDLAVDGFGILEAIRDAAGTISDFGLTYANPALASMLHRSGDNVVGRGIFDLLPNLRTHPAFFQAAFGSSRRASRARPRPSTIPTGSAAGSASTR